MPVASGSVAACPAPVAPAPAGQALAADDRLYRELLAHVRDTGLLERRPASSVAWLAALVMLYAAGLAGLVLGAGLVRLGASMALGAVLVQLAYLGHDAGHQSIATRRWVNRAVGHVAMTLLGGFSFSYWQQAHARHHRHSNEELADPDLQSDLAGLYPSSARAKTGLHAFFCRHQAVLVWVAYALHPFQLRWDGLRHVLAAPRLLRVDAALLFAHLGLALALPTILAGPGPALLAYGVASVTAGLWYGPAFIVNHVGMPTLGPEDQVSVLRRQVEGSRDVRGPRWQDVYFGGLNWQVEHHLFPRVHRRHLRALQPHVRARCLEHGLRHHETTLLGALREVSVHLRAMGRLSGADTTRVG